MDQNGMKKKEGVSFATGLMCLAALFGIWLVLGMFMNPNGSGSGEFTSYRGPVLPMTSLNGAEGVEVQRNVNFDFSPYGTPGDYAHVGKGAAGITDTYRFTNTTGQTQTLELVYGFQGQFIDHPDEFPAITVDGVTVEPVLYPSVDTASLVWYAHNFEKYADVLQEHDFLSVAMEGPALADTPVTVYHFTDLAYTGDELAPYPMLMVSFSKGEGVSLWTEEVAGISTDEKTGIQTLLFRVDRGEAWLIAQGGEPENMTISGNKDYNLKEEHVIDGVTYQLETFQATLGAMLERFAAEYDFWSVEGNDYYPNPGLVTTEILVDGAAKRMASPDWAGAATGVQSFHGLFAQVVTEVRMMYLVFPVELAPGQSVTVEAAYIQEPSVDSGGPKAYREGYELATRLGSDLNFTALTSSLSHTSVIELGKQNFGFDLERGITNVTLDLNVERYYLEVAPKKP